MISNRDFTQKRYYKVFRQDRTKNILNTTKQECSLQKRVAQHFAAMCGAEKPIVFPDEIITFTRTNSVIPEAYSLEDIAKEYDINNKYYNVINNVCPDYSILLKKGLNGLKRDLVDQKSKASSKELDFIDSCLLTIDAIEDLIKRYVYEAQRIGNLIVSNSLLNVPMNPAGSFLEALQSIRIISSMFYLNGNYQLGFGRIDQYLIDYYKHDIENNIITKQQALDYIKEFFVSLNRDTDLYFGVQQGDNGQSMMLGGIRPDGSDGINDLTYLFLEASKELKLIDPKINLRIDSNTPEDLLMLGCELTRAGLGFPQYSNDEVVIPALVKAGYDLEDARNYTVAACWEFIIPGKGLDIVNQGAVSFPYAVNEAFISSDPLTLSEDSLDKGIMESLKKQVKNILENRDQYLLPSPLVSLFFYPSIKEKKDITMCAKYRNRGIHGAGSANAADALYIIRNLIRNNDRATLRKLREAIEVNFDGYDDYREELKNNYPKIGDSDVSVDRELKTLFDWFADACDSFSNRMCKVRAGSGSAQFYIWLANKMNNWIIEPTVGATADGRLAGEPFSSSLAPASGVKINGLMSVLKSFSVIDYSRIMNGGPITVEFSPATLKNMEGLKKLVQVIKYFVKLGDQQLQLNVLDYKVLCDAMKHPEKHANLIVRVWGWSGYFCELAPEFQRQIINRHKYVL